MIYFGKWGSFLEAKWLDFDTLYSNCPLLFVVSEGCRQIYNN